MASGEVERLPLRESADITRARHRVRDCAIALGFDIIAQTRLLTAASELARNTRSHGGGGSVTIEQLYRDGRNGLRLVFEDTGPGIPDLELALTDGWTTGGGLGLGRSGPRRRVDEFQVQSEAGTGTRVEIVHWQGRR